MNNRIYSKDIFLKHLEQLKRKEIKEKLKKIDNIFYKELTLGTIYHPTNSNTDFSQCTHTINAISMSDNSMTMDIEYSFKACKNLSRLPPHLLMSESQWLEYKKTIRKEKIDNLNKISNE